MMNNVDLKMQLLKEFAISDDKKTVDFCREAYKFLVEGDVEKPGAMPVVYPSQDSVKDGVYLVYADGHVEEFTGSNANTPGVRVAFKFGPVALILHDKNFIDVKMKTGEDAKGEDYIKNYDKAAEDFDGAGHTEKLKIRGLSFCLPENTFIPSAGQLLVMFLMKRKLNKALEYLGQDLLTDNWYWSSSETSATLTWGVGFRYGYLGNAGKMYGGRVRPVSAFAIPSFL